MMDSNYPSSSFADALAPAAQPAASWAYGRDSATIKQSSSYGAAQLDAGLLQRQSFTSVQQLPTYTTAHLAAATGALDRNINTSETSIMSFLSAMESRSSASLVAPFRPPSWTAGTNSSTTGLYLTGALPSTATFPSPAALTNYQHTTPYTSKSYSTSSSLALQEPALSTSTNGLLSHQDSLLQLKPSQTALPTALAFNLSGPALGSILPVQSSTYRSAQESAPHLLQPQFNLPAPHIASQSYGATVFSGSVERALQRECSVIKHHQRPSTSHIASDQVSNSEDSLQRYYASGSEGGMSFRQDRPSETPESCSPSTEKDSSHRVNGALQHKADSVTQSYSCTTVPTTKEYSSKLASAGLEESHRISQSLVSQSPESYSNPGQKSNSVISNQLSSLMPSTLSQTYITTHSQSQPPHPSSGNLSSLYKTLPSLSSLSDTGATSTLVYTSGPVLSQEMYDVQVQGLCQGTLSESYSSSHSQNVTYTSESQERASVTQSKRYTTVQSINASYQSTCGQSLSTSAQDYTLMTGSVGNETLPVTISPQATVQTQQIYETVSATYPPTTEALNNNISSSLKDIKPTYGKATFEELPIQELQALQQASMEGLVANGTTAAPNNVIYIVSKMDDLHKTQSVIRDTSHSGDHLTQLNAEQHSHLSGQENANPKTTNSSISTSHVLLSSEPIKQHPVLIKSSEAQQPPQDHTHFITVPSAQVLVEHNQMISLQQPLVHNAQMSSKVVSVQGLQSAQGLGPLNIQYLQMDRELMCPNVSASQSQQATVVSEQSSGCSDSSKDHYSQSAIHQSNDAKNHFALNSLCFSDSMLLVDDRNILSNVDDILAATVAACGVTPQDFVKGASPTEVQMAAMVSPVDAKTPFQTVDITQMSPSFSTAQQTIRSDTNSHAMAMTLNRAQISTHRQGQAIHHSNSSDLNTNGDGDSSESDYHSAGQVYDSSAFHSSVKSNEKCVKTENDSIKCQRRQDFPKKEANFKSLTRSEVSGEDNVAYKPAKRTGQAKRPNSKGGDVSPSASQNVYDGCPQQERIRQKIREVEAKQPEVKTGFIGSFLDFIKSGPKQQYSPSPSRTVSRSKKPATLAKAPPPSCVFTPKIQTLPSSLISQQSQVTIAQQKPLDDELQRNLETLPSFSSDEEEHTGRNQALRNSISSVLSALDEPSERKAKPDNPVPSMVPKPVPVPTVPLSITDTRLPLIPTAAQMPTTVTTVTTSAIKQGPSATPPGQLAVQLISVAIEGLTDEELSDSGGEGMYRERDEFVVRNEDIETLKGTLRAGSEPPAIWKVQKALLQKFVPELRDGKRVFFATNSYLGYFGDAKSMYQRVYVKFLDTVNKREYVRVCSRKPRCKPMNSLRGFQVKTLLGLTGGPFSSSQGQKPRPKPLKQRAEPPPKKRKKWKEALSPAASGSSAEEDELNPPVPFASRLLNTRTMKETFRSFVELLVNVALDEDVLAELERANDALLLPQMRRMDILIGDNRKRLLHKLHIEQALKTALDSLPEITVVTELTNDGETPAFKVRLGGMAYNRKTLKPDEMPNQVPQEYTVDQQKTQWVSLYHSLRHYKYHTYLMCRDEIATLRVQAGELGQEETIQKCLQNRAWLEGLFDRFGELINQVQQACR
ncbi:glutamine and serine-rich protein 1 [Syngnathus typhle]|uniref:glutamine and serine-rich protein 1 n=1 Tax=Syngnathus typhle TaxID=161592 RepID=UPI002A6A6BA2|nr:glutamine and serine-rich protein 1 [Syngnathus typhle]